MVYSKTPPEKMGVKDSDRIINRCLIRPHCGIIANLILGREIKTPSSVSWFRVLLLDSLRKGYVLS